MRLRLISILVLLVASCSSARHSSTSSINSANPDLSSIDPGRYDSTWWNRAPYRLVQTNLREIDATMDVDAYVQSIVEANANVVLINVPPSLNKLSLSNTVICCCFVNKITARFDCSAL